MIRSLAPLVLVAACHYDDVAIAGKQCPCPGGYSCYAGACILGDAPVPDGAAPGDAEVFGSCISNPKTVLVYQSATLSEFPTGFTTLGGAWSVMPGVLHQGNDSATVAAVALAMPGDAANPNYRVVATAKQTTGGVGSSLEVSVRVTTMNKSSYHCGLQPNNGKLGLAVDSTSSTELAAAQLGTLSPMAPYTLELQITGSTIQCCVRGIPAASIGATDATLATGSPGLKTYLMAADFSAFAVYQ